ncbi:hypothetical protein HN709_02470 [Candidatus Peregrinibacteria bacterium]|jgi:hypothetical protein|nr:hypothetical protein [Candidatus Peregrinibacteria bacterium]MBT7736527.1 hypothetical protein [Candidatus Peregrinibacteria bacterium]
MKLHFRKLVHHWKVLLGDKAYSVSLLVGILVFLSSIFVTDIVGTFKDSFDLPAVGDSLLNLLPVLNLDFLFIWGFYLVIFLIVLYPLFISPEKAPFVLKTFGILMLVRACFNLLTDIGPPDGFHFEHIVLNNPLKDLAFRNDLFFSGHTAVPFLAFLIFKNTVFRWFMLVASVILGSTVLLMHVHYSIDVFAAPFIAHGVYVLSDNIFNRLNIRFRKRIKSHGWKSLQQKVEKIKNKIIHK